MIIPLTDGWAVAVSVAAWVLFSVAIGRLAVTWDAERVSSTGPITGLRRWERGGRWWVRHLRVLRWKDRLPEAGDVLGGQQKATLTSGSTEALTMLRGETIRAERVHWLLVACGPLFAIWCRPTVALGMVAFGVAFNAPFIIVQRSNRGRLDHVLDLRHRHRAAGTS